jgi:hypothetical protein
MSQNGISPILNRASELAQNVGYILGGYYQEWALRLINWTTFPYILIGFVVVFVPLKLFLRRRAKQYLNPLSYGLEQVGMGLSNVVIGGLGVAWVNLVIGLSPFFLTVPLTIVPVALYFLLILDVFWLKRLFRKAAWINN